MTNVFSKFQAFQANPSKALLVWDLDPTFTPPGNLTFSVQWSRSGHPEGDDWTEIARVQNQTGLSFKAQDLQQHTWATSDFVFYRAVVTLDSGASYSSQVVSPDFMNFTASEMLIVNQIFRQTAIGFTTAMGGICGLLYRRKNWGQVASTVDPDTQSIVNPRSAEDFGAGYVGGYWPPFSYCIANVPVDRTLYRADLDTRTGEVRTALALAWPIPRTEDLWVDGRSGDRYIIQDVQETSVLRGIPLLVNIQLRKAPPTDVCYKLELPQ